MTGQVLSTAEMHFAASLVPCPTCGAPTPRLDYYGSGEDWILSGLCPSCKTVRRFDFRSATDPLRMPRHPRLELGDSAPSQVISVAQFQAELDRLEPQLRDDPSTLGLDVWATRSAAADRALTCVLELRKFPASAQPPGLDRRYSQIVTLTERFTADAPRMWLLKKHGTLDAYEEVCGLVNQLSSSRAVNAADLERYLAVRRSLSKDGAVRAIRAWDDAQGTHAELTFERAQLDAVAAGTGPVKAQSPTLAVAEQTFNGHRVRAGSSTPISRSRA